MQTKGELISEIKSQVRLQNADATLTNKFIWSLIEKHLRWLIKRENDKLNLLGLDYLFQPYKCVEVEEAPTIDDCCGIRSRCKIYRTVEKLPKMFESQEGVVIKDVITIDGSKSFTQIKPGEYMRKLENPTTVRFDKNLYFFYRDGHLYFPKSTIRKVMIYAYFEEEIKNPCDDACPSNVNPCRRKLDESARIPDHIKGELMDFVIKDIMGTTLQIQPDQQVDKNETRKS